MDLTDQQKATARQMREEWISAGMSEADIATRTAAVASELNCDRRSLGSIMAYVRYSATEALEESGLQNLLTSNQLIEAAVYILAHTPHKDINSELRSWEHYLNLPEGKLLPAVLAYDRILSARPGGFRRGESLDLTLEKIEQKAATYLEGKTQHSGPAPGATPNVPLETRVSKNERAINEYSSDSRGTPQYLADNTVSLSHQGSLPNEIAEAFDIQTLEDFEVPPDQEANNNDRTLNLTIEVLDGSSQRGDLIDYDNPLKERTRIFNQSEIKARMTSSELAHATVLCLPGRKVFPDISKYLELGVPPQNIFAVEGGRPEARAEFEENARRAGIRYYIGDLEEILPRLNETFSIVNLDFLGWMSQGHQRILSSIPLSPEKTVLIYNAQAKRERRAFQDAMNFVEAKLSFDQQALANKLMENAGPPPELLAKISAMIKPLERRNQWMEDRSLLNKVNMVKAKVKSSLQKAEHEFTEWIETMAQETEKLKFALRLCTSLFVTNHATWKNMEFAFEQETFGSRETLACSSLKELRETVLVYTILTTPRLPRPPAFNQVCRNLTHSYQNDTGLTLFRNLDDQNAWVSACEKNPDLSEFPMRASFDMFLVMLNFLHGKDFLDRNLVNSVFAAYYTGRPVIDNVKLMGYNSESSTARTPFHTTIATLHGTEWLERETPGMLDFFSHVPGNLLSLKPKKDFSRVSRKIRELQWNDKFVLKINQTGETSELQVGQINIEYKRLLGITRGWKICGNTFPQRIRLS